ncbi:hypothetical protein FDE76_14855 [Clostridium botulinum]|uniref:Uncharacterized protein n=1 Tax=Clostridium botulinum (strain Eklund 17B / Type B) TaxID=935198 RepID=B2TRS2_CLOBB|nr:hypothetical protein CLL_A2272 [Clostridium botulinum B str. Eklund 17B (NRP)]MBY6975792.1 hypothetical protein [Clostridium botulinum]MBY7000215.1 hypothetical protein [Clostridium botulinum]MCR1272973.1 hypothetical protein [Clostridium botulinum]NFD71491.1 hypothetical protein [Clostridium botulinum]
MQIDLSISQVRTLCECLYDFKIHIGEMPKDTNYHERRKELKIKEVDNLFNLLEQLAKYKGGTFQSALEKCINKKNKKSDIGEDALNLSISGFEK